MICEKNGYTKVELAKMLGVTTRTIAGYEKEDRYPKSEKSTRSCLKSFRSHSITCIPRTLLLMSSSPRPEKFSESADEWKPSSLRWTCPNCSHPGNYPMRIWTAL